MNTNDLNTALYEKMAAEQDKFRDWLKSQPPEEVLNHAYEYTIREDIVMAIEELELTDTQAQALLESSLPLADVYRYFEKLETGHMDVIRDSIENRADDVCRAKEELRTTPIYPHSAAYAREHGELEQYRASNNVNLQCKESIEAAVREHFDGMYLSHDAAKGVIETYGMERVSMVLSNTVQLQDWDGRYSRRNKEWAKTIPNDNPETVRCGYALNSHPAVLDGFIDLVREEQQRSRTQREKLEPSRHSVRDKLKQELPNHICGKGMINKIRELYPQANITPIDYDPSATRVNQENRIKLMLAVARERLNQRSGDKAAHTAPVPEEDTASCGTCGGDCAACGVETL